MDCYGEAEVASALHVYLSDALDYPFPAQRRNGRRRIPLVVLELADDWEDRRGLTFTVDEAGDEYDLPAHEVYSRKPTGRIATVLDDYRAWWPYDLVDDDDAADWDA